MGCAAEENSGMQYLGSRRSADSVAYISSIFDSPDPVILCSGIVVSYLSIVRVDA
jgi:hypothetical protein